MNERLTQVGPGTPCGELMRRYWIPIAPYAQLSENPVRKVRILGEDLVLYRDRSNGLGLIGDRCLHRRVDLQFGIPDEHGLRCPYHGWLFGATGACLERPLEAHPQREMQQKLKGYPVQELGGMVFAYMGPLPAPALPRWDLYVHPNSIRQIAVNVLDCNWLQCQENTGDPLHSVWVHGRHVRVRARAQRPARTRASERSHDPFALEDGRGDQRRLRRAHDLRHAQRRRLFEGARRRRGSRQRTLDRHLPVLHADR